MDPPSPEKKINSDIEKSEPSLKSEIAQDIVVSTSQNGQEGQMQRRLKSRHVSMIAIGGSFIYSIIFLPSHVESNLK